MCAQLEESTWFLGGPNDVVQVGMKFAGADNAPVPFNDTRYPLNLQENNIMVADGISGDIKFYSDGLQVIDNSHQPMPNGADLSGTFSSMYGISAVLDPSSCNRYYLFYSEDEEGSPPEQLYYSIIDMDLIGNGTVLSPLGDVVVTQKNIPLLGPNQNVAEGIYAIPKSSTSKESWLLAADINSNNLFIFDVSTSGIQLHGTYFLGDLFDNYPVSDPLFGIRFLYYGDSEDSGRLAIAPGRSMNGNYYPIGFVNFNPLTGVIMDAQATLIFHLTEWTYGLEFSPDGTKLYYSDYFQKALWQYDFASSSNIQIDVSTHVGRAGGLKLAPDGKIYWANRYINADFSPIKSLAAINNPNALGSACELEYDAYMFNGSPNPMLLGALPTFGSFPAAPLVQAIKEASCGYNDGRAEVLSNVGTAPFTYSWDNGEQTLIALNLTAGIHTVTITDVNGCEHIGQVEIDESQFFSNVDLTITAEPINNCIGTPDGSLEISHPGIEPNSLYTINYVQNGEHLGPFLLSADAQGLIFVNDLSAGIYNDILIINQSSCRLFIQAETEIPGKPENLPPVINIGGAACVGDTIILSIDTINPLASYEWTDPVGNLITGSTVSLGPLSTLQNGNYQLQSYIVGCAAALSTVDLIVEDLNFDLGPDIQSCDPSIVLSLPESFEEIQWSDGTQSNSLDITATGQYSFSAYSENGCLIEDTITIELPELTDLNLPDVIEIQECESFILEAEYLGNDNFYNWFPDEGVEISCANCMTPAITAAASGWIQVEASYPAIGCYVYDSIQVVLVPNYDVFIPNAFSPNGDGTNDEFTVFAKNPATKIEKMEIYSRWGELVFSKHDFPANVTAQGWDGDANSSMPEGKITELFSEGIFVYKIELLFVNGTRRSFAGDVSLIQ